MIHPKVIAGSTGAGLAGSVTTLILWALGSHGIEVPGPQAVAIGAVVSAIIGFASGYATPSSNQGATPNV